MALIFSTVFLVLSVLSVLVGVLLGIRNEVVGRSRIKIIEFVYSDKPRKELQQELLDTIINKKEADYCDDLVFQSTYTKHLLSVSKWSASSFIKDPRWKKEFEEKV